MDKRSGVLAEGPKLDGMIMRIRLPVLVMLLLPIFPAVGEKHVFERELMATRFTIVAYTQDRELVEKAAEAAFALAEKVNFVASDYLPDSELGQLTTKPVNVPVSLSPLLHDLLDHSRKLAEATQGAFDPTLGPLTKLWRETRKNKCLPDPQTLQTARAATGWKHFSLNREDRSITLLQKNMAFDLGGIAKGYAADLMLESLIAAGIPQSMVTAGGDIRLGDPPLGRDGWNVAVQTFDLKKRDEILVLANAAVSTSGDLHQSVEIDGLKYSHVLDPGTGVGLTKRIAATVIADSGKLSDPIATAACVLGEENSGLLKKISGVREVKIRTFKEPLSGQGFGVPVKGSQNEK